MSLEFLSLNVFHVKIDERSYEMREDKMNHFSIRNKIILNNFGRIVIKAKRCPRR